MSDRETPADVLRLLVQHGSWYHSAIELGFRQDGEELLERAEQALATVTVEESPSPLDLDALARETARRVVQCDFDWRDAQPLEDQIGIIRAALQRAQEGR